MDMLLYMEERANHLGWKRKTLPWVVWVEPVYPKGPHKRSEGQSENGHHDCVHCAGWLWRWRIDHDGRGHMATRGREGGAACPEPLEAKHRALTWWTCFIFLASRTWFLCLYCFKSLILRQFIIAAIETKLIYEARQLSVVYHMRTWMF
jgi:hypothetical protein